MKPDEILSKGDELNLYLVMNGLKPASMVLLSPIGSKIPIIQTEECKRKIKYVSLKLEPTTIPHFQSYLDNINIYYKQKPQQNIQITRNANGEKTYHQTSFDNMFYVGSTKSNLDKLLSAKTNKQIGTALGFPKESIDTFQKNIDGVIRNGTYVQLSLAKAKETGIEFPSWMAYICFVPENLDFVNGNISQTSKTLAERYQSFVRKNNNSLAKEVEDEFRKQWDRLELTPDGGFCYRFKPN